MDKPLTARQYEILKTMETHGPLSVSELAQHLGIHRESAREITNRMVQAGHLQVLRVDVPTRFGGGRPAKVFFYHSTVGRATPVHTPQPVKARVAQHRKRNKARLALQNNVKSVIGKGFWRQLTVASKLLAARGFEKKI